MLTREAGITRHLEKKKKCLSCCSLVLTPGREDERRDDESRDLKCGNSKRRRDLRAGHTALEISSLSHSKGKHTKYTEKTGQLDLGDEHWSLLSRHSRRRGAPLDFKYGVNITLFSYTFKRVTRRDFVLYTHTKFLSLFEKLGQSFWS